jgi:hypothetical protein
LDEAKRFAAFQGWTRLEVTAVTERINPRTLGFYKKENFVELGSRLKFEMGKAGSK